MEEDLEFCYYSGSESEIDEFPNDSLLLMSHENTDTAQDELHDHDVVTLSSDEENDRSIDRTKLVAFKNKSKEHGSDSIQSNGQDQNEKLHFSTFSKYHQPEPIILSSDEEEEVEVEEQKSKCEKKRKVGNVKSKPLKSIAKKDNIRNILLKRSQQKRGLKKIIKLKKRMEKIYKKKSSLKPLEAIKENQNQTNLQITKQVTKSPESNEQSKENVETAIPDEKSIETTLTISPVRTSARIKNREQVKKNKQNQSSDQTPTIKPVGQSATAFTDSDGNLYRLRFRSGNGILYLKCSGKDCNVNVSYNFPGETVRFRGEHSKHPKLNENDIRIMEFNQAVRNKVNDPNLRHLKRVDIYNKCIEEFRDISFPDPVNHRKKVLKSIRCALYRNNVKGAASKMAVKSGNAKNTRNKQATPTKKQSKAGNLIGFKSIAGSKALFKDSSDNLYRRLCEKETENTKDIYYQCQWKNCPVIITQNLNEPKVLCMNGPHIDHPKVTNDIRRIELSRYIRTKALQINYIHVKSADIYDQCFEEFEGIETIVLPDDYRQKSMDAIEKIRKQFQIKTT